ncbi:MAG: molecular chaperone HtpG, partial [Clostridia bacterium]|nr:molecular chaperone HtpG [Clostridia bacterium]
MSENNKRGGISVEAEHIFPIIKKWLYSDKEIFLREIVSNAVDAETKLKRLVSLGEVRDISVSDLSVRVELDTELNTITVTDNGIGMTADEVEKYICSIALSGALDFIKEYEGESDGKNGIIGHFGLGFYSAFMVADKVEVFTKSYKDAPAVYWVCDSNGSYEMSEGDREERGTEIVMHIGEEGKEYLDKNALRAILAKYCSFLPVPVYFEGGCECEHHHHEGECDCGHDHGDGHECECKTPINDTAPLWQKSPSECTDEEYKEFYRKVFNDWREPLLTVHINADYPLNFRGILFFPRRENEFENTEGQIKLYYNQMFVADNIREVIPEHLLMLRGVLDCPELPLNVSRSYLQNNTYVKKIAAHITKKVADKLVFMMENQRERYETIWQDIKTFAEYSCMCDPKFFDRAESAMLLPICGGGFKTLDEYLETAKEKHENTVYYAGDEQIQAQY